MKKARSKNIKTNALLNYGDILSKLKSTTHLLLGNGFSIACDPIFSYGNLYEIAKKYSLNERNQKIFEQLGTNNFEGVLKHLDHFRWMLGIYDLGNPTLDKLIVEDLSNVKQGLLNAISETHPKHSGIVEEKKKVGCTTFLKPFHSIFTTSYDLLLYWVELFSMTELQGRDGFSYDENNSDAPYCIFCEHIGRNKGIFFIHGGLHLFTNEGEIRKHSWNKSQIPLIQNLKDCLSRGEYPLFVAEGDSVKKMEQICQNAYLSYSFGKLSRVESDLVVYGLSFGESDAHIANAIVHSKTPRIFVSVYGDPNTADNIAILNNVARLSQKRNALIVGEHKKYRGWPTLEYEFYDAESAKVWG